jgi:hypothetical protein
VVRSDRGGDLTRSFSGQSHREIDEVEHKHTPEEERRIREAALDETLAETFPASDAPSTLPNPDDDALLPKETDTGAPTGRPDTSSTDER